jgi:hypothetical protein
MRETVKYILLVAALAAIAYAGFRADVAYHRWIMREAIQEALEDETKNRD